jgi:hypothetical protein
VVAKYTVVQYVPRPLADERVNIGLIAWDDNGSIIRCTEDWSKAKALGGDEVQLLKQILKEVQGYVTSASPRGGHGSTDELVGRLIGRWEHKVQFTPERGSLRSAAELVREISPVFLPTKLVRKSRGRTRRSAVSLALRTARKAATEVSPSMGADLVKPRYVATGALDSHRFDVALANGSLLGAVNALSFEAEFSASLAKDVDATAWAFDDLLKAHPMAPLGVFLLPPRTAETRKEYGRAVRIFEGLGASVFDQQAKMEGWVSQRIAAYR